MRSHPIAELFPMIEGEDWEKLVADIREHGVRQPVVLYEGKILDGRNRWKAAKRLEVEAPTEDFEGTYDEAVRLSISLNLARRHLNETQKADVACDVEKLFAKEAKRGRPQNSVGGKKNGGRSTTISRSREKAAKVTGTSASMVQHAKKVREKGTPKLKEAQKRGIMPATVGSKVAEMAPEKQDAVVAKVESGTTPAQAMREVRLESVVVALEDVETRAAKAVEGVYDVLVIDPPWPMEKIERDERPNQVAFDYPTMSEDELRELEVPCAEDCHVWLWTTHKFLPMAFRLLEAWDLKYVCAFVWHKPGGFQPIGLPQYNCEFALYARRGSPVFVDTKALPTCFNAPRGRHSEKPGEFYEVVRRVTAGRRLDMFNRRAIPGFDAWGKEAHDAAE